MRGIISVVIANTRLQLAAEKRTIVGHKVKKLRADGKVPANVFGKHIKSQAVAVDRREFDRLFRRAGETTLVDLSIKGEGKARPILISQVQWHPLTDRTLHIDLRQVDLAEKVTASVPLQLVGEAPAVKDKGAVMFSPLSEITVEALPTELPDHIEVDITRLVEFGDSILVKDLKVDRSKVTVTNEAEETVVTVQAPKAEVIEAPAAPVEGEAAVAAGENGEAQVAGQAEAPPPTGQKTAPAEDKK